MPDVLNPRQREILEYLRVHARRHAYPPTVREIGQAVGLSSSSTVQNHLNALEQKGFIRRDPTKSRTVEVVDDGADDRAGASIRLPVIGRVAAGSPVLAEANVEDHIVVGESIAGSGDVYALRVHGDSMINAGILDGDLVLVRSQSEATNGAIVVARIEHETTGDSEVTVKRFFREARRIRLQPENDALDPLYATAVTIEGIVIAVVRVLR